MVRNNVMIKSHRSLDYSQIAFNERVNFCLQRIQSLPCAVRMLPICARDWHITITQSHTHTMQPMHAQAKKLLSCRKQQYYSTGHFVKTVGNCGRCIRQCLTCISCTHVTHCVFIITCVLCYNTSAKH